VLFRNLYVCTTYPIIIDSESFDFSSAYNFAERTILSSLAHDDLRYYTNCLKGLGCERDSSKGLDIRIVSVDVTGVLFNSAVVT